MCLPPTAGAGESYSGDIVLADVAALGMVAGASALPVLGAAAVASYLFTPAVIHLLHDNPGRAAGSLGLRLLLPVGGAFLGATLENCRGQGESLCGVMGLMVGGLTGIVAAAVIDAAALAGDRSGSAPGARPVAHAGGGGQLRLRWPGPPARRRRPAPRRQLLSGPYPPPRKARFRRSFQPKRSRVRTAVREAEARAKWQPTRAAFFQLGRK